MVENTGFTE